MDKSSALEKIKKCLALSRSANEHEAAQALKHAQALMAKYGLTGWDVELAEVSEQYGKAPKSAPSWHWRLVHLCGSAFGCDRWHAADRSGGRFVFCGINDWPRMLTKCFCANSKPHAGNTSKPPYCACGLSATKPRVPTCFARAGYPKSPIPYRHLPKPKQKPNCWNVTVPKNTANSAKPKRGM